jgi:hypothetical protein
MLPVQAIKALSDTIQESCNKRGWDLSQVSAKLWDLGKNKLCVVTNQKTNKQFVITIKPAHE